MITVPAVPDSEAVATRLAPYIREHAPRLRDLANSKYTQGFPADWPLSSGRMSLTALTAQARPVHQLASTAFDQFEAAAAELVAGEPKVANQLMAGVEIDPAVRNDYIKAPKPFTVRRLDVLQTPDGVCVTENDEQPGGIGLSYLYDLLYGVNLDRWKAVWNSLTSNGKLVFVVSHDWSQGYHGEIRWLVRRLKQEGYDVEFVSTNELSRLTVDARNVRMDGAKVGTIFRLFPIFETQGKLVKLVHAAKRRTVRMVPEFASWGNKTWFALFHEHLDHFRRCMNPSSFRLLQQVIPDTVLMQEGKLSRPFVVDGHAITTIEELGGVSTKIRRQLVIKATGASRQSARAHGVSIGSSFSGTGFRALLSRIGDGPFLVQRYTKGAEYAVPAYSVLEGRGTVETFHCRMLMRPWSVNGINVGLVTASPRETSLIHGTTASAFIPLDYRS